MKEEQSALLNLEMIDHDHFAEDQSVLSFEIHLFLNGVCESTKVGDINNYGEFAFVAVRVTIDKQCGSGGGALSCANLGRAGNWGHGVSRQVSG